MQLSAYVQWLWIFIKSIILFITGSVIHHPGYYRGLFLAVVKKHSLPEVKVLELEAVIVHTTKRMNLIFT